MSGKEPKDMTAAELLRWAAENDKLRMRCDMCMKLYMMDSCGGHDCNDWLIDLADKIEADLAKARRGGLERCAKSWAKANGWPDFREGEGFGEWLERCFIQRPLDENGEPVQFGDDDIDWDYTAECRISGSRLNATAVDIRGKLLATTFDKIVAVAKTDEHGRVKRTAPEVLLADGLPAKVGETVYRVDTGKGFEIARIAPMCPGDDMSETLVLWGDDNEWRAAIDHTHTPPVPAADGLPMREGETVWLTDEGARHAGDSDTMAEVGPYALCGIGANDRLTVKALPSRFHPNRVDLVEEGAWCPASWLTHEEPDTQERIDEDAQKSTLEYWGCRDASCECCPAETDGKTPRGRFDARNCQQAQLLDLLRRQRELDARKGGE